MMLTDRGNLGIFLLTLMHSLPLCWFRQMAAGCCGICLPYVFTSTDQGLLYPNEQEICHASATKELGGNLYKNQSSIEGTIFLLSGLWK